MLKDEVLAAMIAFENKRPRNQQVTLGPSDYGHCREYLRNVLAGTPTEPQTEWPTAAVMGTLGGDYMEKAVEQEMGASIQVPVTTTLPNGLTMSGTADMVFPERNLLADAKSKDGLDNVRRYGASLENKIQVSIYTLGLVQMGILEEGAQAILLYFDRSGREQVLEQETLYWDDILNHIEIVMDRIEEVLDAQEHIDKGEVEYARALRDKTPPFCFSERVMCPFRHLCWDGSEWVPNQKITDPDTIEVVRMYVEARSDVQGATDRKEALREALIGVTGVTPDGFSVAWPGTGKALYVTRVKENKK